MGSVASPEGRPWFGEMAEAEDEELGWVEEGPGAVGEVAGTHILVRLWSIGRGGRESVANLQHAVRLVPVQIVLDIHRRLCLYRESDQAQSQEPCRVCISLPIRILGPLCSILLPKPRRSPPAERRRVRLLIIIWFVPGR